MKTHTIDATDKSLGRVASEAASVLLGKDSPDFTKNQVADVKVVIENTSKTKKDEKRMKKILHSKFSGYPSGLKFESNLKIIKEKGWGELYRIAVKKMLPSNKLRPLMMKNLEIKE
ncbi:MAG: uL13 family ribosomal protein [Patescibacteria group bacterium]|nr:uL13 family ribosomal protein [Patescibacteria group bacterium]